MRVWVALAVTLASAGIAAILVVLALGIAEGDEPASAGPPATTNAEGSASTSRETCETRSSGRFGERPFRNPNTLVVGPLALVGGAKFTPPSVVRGVKGQKFPLLVRAGHEVRLEVPPAARRFAGLGYGRLPQGEITLAEAHQVVTFTACSAKATGPTFWSGSVVAQEPHCVPLDVYVDGGPDPLRIVLELGVRPCAA